MADQQKIKHLREKISTWDQRTTSMAPLSERQKDSYMDLTSHASNRPLPIELPLEEAGSFSQQLSLVSTPSLSHSGDSLAEGFSSLGMKDDKIENAQQFFDWFNKVESQMEQEEELCYRSYCDQLSQYKEQCDLVMEEVSTALDQLKDLKQQYVLVATKTNALHEACEQSMADQTMLVNKAEAISCKLDYFNELERINQKLSSPTFAVTNDSFVPLLSKLDECIAYIIGNPQYKESELFQARFKQCLSKALTLIKAAVFTILNGATQQVVPKDVTSTSENAFTLFYGKFRSNAPKIKALMEQVEQRLDKTSEYTTLLDDCLHCYFSKRYQLLMPSIQMAVSELATKHARDHCSLVRSGCAFMVHVCEDEYQLFFHFFSKSSEKLDAMLEQLCMSLYDVLRPLIIHINHLETLAELCSILKTEMLQDHVQANPNELGAFAAVANQMLEDVQERLVYRSSVYIKSDILNYNPASGDLAYPEKLEMMESIAESLREQRLNDSRRNSGDSIGSATSHEVAALNQSGSALMSGQTTPPEGMRSTVMAPIGSGAGTATIHVNASLSPADLHGMWYPTVRRTLVCLSKLYRCIDKSIFQGLSQEILQSCIHSLNVACQGITKRKTQLNGQLFLIKHLLILREQIAPFQVEFSIKETGLDFSTLKAAAYGMFQKPRGLFVLSSNNSFLEFLFEGAPQVTEHYVDSKKDVDHQLKCTCEVFIKHVTDLLASELIAFQKKAQVIVDLNEEESGASVSLRSQPFASPERVHEVVGASYKQIKTQLPKVFQSMSLYLANKDTEYILFRPIKAGVQLAYQQVEELVKNNYSEEDQQIIACPSKEQVNLFLAASP
ncbi:conserved oligomeric Golgi complex subunit 3 [Strongylocentrotus purpuratus]|uniref:Conserved oligomeric Golgi complex subunit 3 n=1 Tax=Strongylocentrotus purpuratus TaxID=7668 RepID=A0A7M7NJP6_STRPU|nr:conserved oligomeric Golgi complex subunit 3 [Strongylocentrotus purpuratus]